MAPPTVTGMSVQFQPVMQTQVVDNPQIIDQASQQIQHINQTIQQPVQMQQQMQPQLQQQLQQQMQQPVIENQQKVNGMSFSVQNMPQCMPYPSQVTFKFWKFR